MGVAYAIFTQCLGGLYLIDRVGGSGGLGGADVQAKGPAMNLRAEACLIHYGAHFMEKHAGPGQDFVCRHCGLSNLTQEFMIGGVNWWKGFSKVRASKDGQQVYAVEYNATIEEVRHALRFRKR